MSENLSEDDGVYLSLWRGPLKVNNGRAAKAGNTTTMRQIATDVALDRGVSFGDLIMPDHVPGARAFAIAHPRQEAMWRMHQTGKWSLPQIGRFLGERDHTTCLHGIRAHAKRIADGKEKQPNKT
jgi:chromosomal replication initiation ATPase DnaA